jgi:hypothetical protein
MTDRDTAFQESTSDIRPGPKVPQEAVIDSQVEVPRRAAPPRLTNRRLLWFIAFGPAFVTMFVCTATRAFWVGRFHLDVSIVNRHAAPIASLQLRTGFDRIDAAPEARQLAGANVAWSFEANPYRGEPISIEVRSAGETDFFFEYQYSQECCLYVVAEFADGKRTARFVDIPDGRKTRTMMVQLP